ncbi:hypothetical protein V3851_21040 [Paenibacillus sp. M1]|uniref:Uncharacterized protein n=1 Tax=Paenibacillus haidiansis TaxID=1574488 RepID=A0ABU7VY50_9BACL|nr:MULTISPECIES: hypothetical protein [Paenibacillus]
MSKEIMDAFEKMADLGNGVLAIPPHNEKERKERDRLMQEYLRNRTTEKKESLHK